MTTPLNTARRRTITAIADVLIPERSPMPKASDAPDFDYWLDVAVAARSDAAELLDSALDELAHVEDLDGELRRLDEHAPDVFGLVSSVAAGAYYMIPQIRSLIGYPGPHRDPARVDLAADDLDGLIDVVIERGYCGRPADGSPPARP